MIERLNDNVGIHAIIDKVNEIIDFVNDTFLTDVNDGIFGRTTISSYDFVEQVPLETIPSVHEVHNTVKCPNCGESYYTIEYGESTCVYYPPIIKDGVNINPDRNMHTQHCRCLSCQTRFDI